MQNIHTSTSSWIRDLEKDMILVFCQVQYVRIANQNAFAIAWIEIDSFCYIDSLEIYGGLWLVGLDDIGVLLTY